MDIFRNEISENQPEVKALSITSDDELMFESLDKEESYVGKMILNGRSWLVLQLQRVIGHYLISWRWIMIIMRLMFYSQSLNGSFTAHFLLDFLFILALLWNTVIHSILSAKPRIQLLMYSTNTSFQIIEVIFFFDLFSQPKQLIYIIFEFIQGLALLSLTLLAALLLLWDLGVKRLYSRLKPRINAQSIAIHPVLKKPLRLINRFMSW